MRILGIDPGLRKTGFGVIEVTHGKLHYIDSGVIVIATDKPLSERLKTIYDGIDQVATMTQPTCAAIEIVFVNTNPSSTLLLGQARGAALCSLAKHHLDVHEYTALQIKKSVVGAGHADKKQVQLMVQHLLKLNAPPSTDSADALACAMCLAHTLPMQTQLGLQSHLGPQNGLSRLRHGRLIR